MTWSGLYPFVLVIHVLSVFAFLAIHGISMGVWWRVRRERERAKLVPWLELSAASVVPMGIAALLLIVSGILVGVAGDWWFNGQWWLWVSMGTLVVIVAVMTPLVSVPMGDIRRGIGIPTQADTKGGIVPTPVDDAALDRLRRDPRPAIGGTIAIVGIVLITWLMETKPI